MFYSYSGHVYYKIHDGIHNIAQAQKLCKPDASFLTLPMPRNEEQNDYWDPKTLVRKLFDISGYLGPMTLISLAANVGY